MPHPTEYYVRYEDVNAYVRLCEQEGTDDIDPEMYTDERDFVTLRAARRFTKSLRGWWQIWQRYNYVDVTPIGDPPGLLWEGDERLIDES